jgi:histidine phosphotransfer protein HptB
MSHNTIVADPLYSPLANDPDLGEIVDMFVDEMPERVTLIQQLLEASDWEGVRRAAHQLKGSAGSHGFMPISPVAATVEQSVTTGQPEEDIRRAAEALCEMCGRVRAGTPG